MNGRHHHSSKFRLNVGEVPEVVEVYSCKTLNPDMISNYILLFIKALCEFSVVWTDTFQFLTCLTTNKILEYMKFKKIRQTKFGFFVK